MPTFRKKILIINSHFGIGGIETAMVNMANELCIYYDVDLFVYYPEGPMKERLDSRVNILESSFAFKAIGMSFKQALASKRIMIILYNLFGLIWTRVFDNRLPVFIATRIQKKLCGYDLAIAYRQENQKNELASGYVRFLNHCVKAKKKIAWIHCDSTFFPESQAFNRKYYMNVDKIIGVSKSVSEAFERMNPELSEKIDYCYNFLDCDEMLLKSKDKQHIEYLSDKFVCFSASRFSVGKAIERTIYAIAPVMHKETDIMWYIAGDGIERENIESAIKREGLQERIILLGNQSNPYPYMKNADLFMLTSYHEAAPMVYMEAKVLGTPVFTTNTLSSLEMLEDGVDAFICENSDEGIRKKFFELMAERERITAAKDALKNYRTDNSASIRKITELIN